MATVTKGKTFANGETVTPAKLHQLVDSATVTAIVNADVSNTAAIALSKLATGALPPAITVASANIVNGTIVNADVSTSAAIADTKLAAIATAGKVANSATTATSANTANAIVARNVSGNFIAGTITAALSGNATTATTLQTARTIGGVSFNGSANINLPGVNTAGNQNTTGNAATATRWATSRSLALTGNVTATLSSVNGSANVSAVATIANNAVTTVKIADANVTKAKLDTATQRSLVPPGAIMAFATTTAPSGWLYCNGANNLSKTTYNDLFLVVGTSFGSGITSSTFKIPNLRGVFVRGDGSQTITDLRGESRTYSATFANTLSDSIQKMTGAMGLKNGDGSFGFPLTAPSNAGVLGRNSSVTGVPPAKGGGSVTAGLTFDSSNQVSSGTETKPANVVLRYFIKF